MALTEGDLVGQAVIKIQQSAEIAKHQKQANQDARQLFADCVSTLEAHGTRFSRDAVKLGALTVTAPTVLLARSIFYLQGIADCKGFQVPIELLTEGIPRKTPTITIWLQGVNHRLELNKRLGYGGIYSNNPRMNEATQYKRMATLGDVASFREALESMEDFIKADVVPWPKDVEEYNQMDDSTLERALKRTKMWSNINCELGRWGMVGALLGLVAGGLSGRPEGVYGGTGVILGGGVASLGMSARLNRRVMVIQDEIASRG